MVHQAYLSVDRLGSMDGPAAENLVNALHSQTNPQKRNFSIKRPDQFPGDPAVFGGSRTGADDDKIGRQIPDFPEGNFIRAKDMDM